LVKLGWIVSWTNTYFDQVECYWKSCKMEPDSNPGRRAAETGTSHNQSRTVEGSTSRLTFHHKRRPTSLLIKLSQGAFHLGGSFPGFTSGSPPNRDNPIPCAIWSTMPNQSRNPQKTSGSMRRTLIAAPNKLHAASARSRLFRKIPTKVIVCRCSIV
jgi:hypothetical protein